jgi:regulator of sigma E protease
LEKPVNIVTLLEFILFFGLMLFIHEFGHFIVAKILGIKVDEFGFGFPPRIVKLFKVKETEVTLNWIPFGAFVRLSGETDPSVPGGFGQAKPLARIAVLLAGPFMNLLAGVILFVFLFTNVGVPDTSKVLVTLVEPDSPAAQSGLQVGDIITQVNQTPITNSDALINIVQDNKGNQITIDVQRGNQTLTVDTVPRVNPPAGQGALGIGMSNPIVTKPWIDTIPIAFQATYDQINLTLQMPGKLIRGEITGDQARVVGPVGMYSMFSQAVQSDESAPAGASPANHLLTLQLMIAVTIALGLTNLLPIPALDGGRILFVLPELVVHRRVPAKYENLVHMIGFIALLVLMFFVTAQDIINPIKLP